MIRGFYTAASGMLYETQRQENIAQNMANAQTNGFKQSYLIATAQEEFTLSNQYGASGIGGLTMKVGLDESYLDLSQGTLSSTSRYLDCAIEGDGFFTLQGPNGLLYTRDGSFNIDGEGYLVSSEGYPVLSNQGPIRVNQDNFSVSSTGVLTTATQTYQMSIVNLPNQANIIPNGNNTYSYEGENPIQATQGFTLYQGMLEGSNVSTVDEMVSLIESSRAFQLNSKVLQAYDGVMEQIASQIGRV